MKQTNVSLSKPAKRATIKKRNLIAKDMHTSGIYRPKVEFGIKVYKRHPKHRGSDNGNSEF